MINNIIRKIQVFSTVRNCQVLWFTPIIPALERLRQKDCECQVSLVYTARPCKKTNK
jgi:hypothetical protein